MLDITIRDMQNYLRVNTEEDAFIIKDLLESTTRDVELVINKDTLTDIEKSKANNVVKKIVAIEYENRTTDNIDLINKELSKLAGIRRNPGL